MKLMVKVQLIVWLIATTGMLSFAAPPSVIINPDEPVVSAPPLVKLSGPETAAEGDIIEIDASASTGASYYSWEVFDTARPDTTEKLWREYEKGSKIVLAHRRGSVYHVRVVGGNASGGTTEKWKVVCEPGGVNPKPDENAPPDLPLGLSKLAANGLAVKAAAGAGVDSVYREAAVLAGNYRTVIKQLENTPKMTPAQADDSLKALNRTTIPEEWRARWDAWMVALSVRLKELDAAKQMQDSVQVKIAFNEIATGLEWVAGQAKKKAGK